MKIKIFKALRPAFPCRRGCGWRFASVVAVLLLATGKLIAMPAVETITGGPSEFYPSPPYGYVDGNTAGEAKFNGPWGLALGNAPEGFPVLYVADRTNNAIRKLDLDDNQTITFLPNGVVPAGAITNPVGVAVDGATNLYVLNRGNGRNGTVLKVDFFGNPLPLPTNVMALTLTNANGIAVDYLTNIYITIQSNTVLRIEPSGLVTNVATITNAGTSLKGIACLANGSVAVCDAGRHGILLIDPATGTVTNHTGFNGAGDGFGTKAFAKFNQPYGIAAAGGGYLVVTDYGNHRVKVVNPAGTVGNLYGVCSNNWVVAPGDPSVFPGWYDGNGCSAETTCQICNQYAEARLPVGVVVAPSGDVYSTETYYHIIRQTTGTGLSGPDNASPPGITAQPTNQSVCVGGTATFSVTAAGLQPLTYQWRFNGTNIAGANSSSHSIYNAQLVNAGYYSVVVSNAFGSTNSTDAVLTVNVGPTITTHPQSLEVGAGDNAMFTVLADGTGPFHYQWRFNGGPIAGATASSLTIVNAQATNVGSYSVVITNACGSAISSNAFLAVATAPLIIVQPQDQIVRLGSNAAFNVTAVGGSPLSYQWYFNSVFIPGATATNLTLLNVQSSNAGPYTVVVANPFGSVTSAVAQLVVLVPPTISPYSGYYPMGRMIDVTSGLPDVFFTMDGTEPTTNSARVTLVGSTGTIRWINPTNDLTALRIKGFFGTNSTTTVSGQPVTTNSVGVPLALYGDLQAGVGSRIVVPVVANLRTNDQVRSYQFKVQITPDGSAPMISDQFQPLSITSNEFIRVVTSAQGDAVASINVTPYTIGNARGLEITAIGTNANVFFQRFAVVAMLAVPIPGSAQQGDTYSISVLNGSATSDGVSSPVAFPSMPDATILVTNVAYTVGDSVDSGWYNAGEFGDADLDNSDVNNAFYAAAGLRWPYPFSDVYDAMDAYPEDEAGFVGGDAEIRFLDWQVILQRSLRQVPYYGGTNNWMRAWLSGGDRTNWMVTLPSGSPDQEGGTTVGAPWNRQAKVGAISVGNAVAGSQVNVPVYVRTVWGATLAGLQFRCIVTPDNGGPALSAAPTFVPVGGLATPIQQSFKPGEFACGWSLNTVNGVNCAAHTSNYLGTVRFTIPQGAASGHTYTVAFANADGAPDIHTQYTFETKRATVVVGAPAPPVTDITSDDWKAYFFGSLADPDVDPNADPDHDGAVNWAEYVAGTDPTDGNSRLKCDSATRTVSGQRQVVLNWLSAPGKAYEVLGSSSANGGAWSVLGTIPGDGNAAEHIETNPAGARFYRLRVLP